ncbi:MAG: amidohydrolase family protein [Stagnimonas sp.]|nr:amidohydrolase family protein [Stagnimonas sp.]
MTPQLRITLTLVLVAGTLAGCKSKTAEDTAAPFASTYVAPATAPILIQHATVLTGTGVQLDDADVLIQDGKISAVRKDAGTVPGAKIIDAKGRYVTPGLIDAHSHLGVYPSPEVWAHSDGNEATAPTTAEVWSEHSVWPQDPGFEAARAGGITSLLILPGSANLIGGRAVVLKNVPAVTYQEMKFPGAPQSMKMACGENPKRVYGLGGKRAPSTRMGNIAGTRAAFAKAKAYQKKMEAGSVEERDLAMETLVGVLKGEILVQNHCYRADEMATMLDVAKEFGYKISAFHHAVEAYKIADQLAQTGTCAALWADWWGFKLEAFDGIRENIALVDAGRGKDDEGKALKSCAIVHSDDPYGIQRLNQEAAKAMTAGRRMGLTISDAEAIAWVTANPAKAIGILDKTGTLEAGKNGDVVIWNGTPFSSYALADVVLIDGVVRYDRSVKTLPQSDFLLGLEPPETAAAKEAQP